MSLTRRQMWFFVLFGLYLVAFVALFVMIFVASSGHRDPVFDVVYSILLVIVLGVAGAYQIGRIINSSARRQREGRPASSREHIRGAMVGYPEPDDDEVQNGRPDSTSERR